MREGPRAWLFCDAPYAGGAERYLEWLLAAAGPSRLGLVAVDHGGLRPWIEARAAEGFAVERLDVAGRVSLWRSFHARMRQLRPRLLHVNLPGPYEGLLATAPALAKAAGVGRVLVTEHLPSVGRVGRRWRWKRLWQGAVDVAICVTAEHRLLMREVLGYGEEQVVAIPNGVPDPNPGGEVAALGPGRFPEELAARERG